MYNCICAGYEYDENIIREVHKYIVNRNKNLLAKVEEAKSKGYTGEEYLEKLKDTKYGERIIDRLTQFMNQQGFSYKPINLEPQYGQNFNQKTQVLDKKFSSMVKEYNLYDPKELKKAIIELTEFCHYDNFPCAFVQIPFYKF